MIKDFAKRKQQKNLISGKYVEGRNFWLILGVKCILSEVNLVVDWPNVKFSKGNFCDFVKMVGEFLAFPMTK